MERDHQRGRPRPRPVIPERATVRPTLDLDPRPAHVVAGPIDPPPPRADAQPGRRRAPRQPDGIFVIRRGDFGELMQLDEWRRHLIRFALGHLKAHASPIVNKQAEDGGAVDVPGSLRLSGGSFWVTVT